MAIDSVHDRISMLNFGDGNTYHIHMAAETPVGLEDRQQLLDCYSGIAFAAPAVVEADKGKDAGSGRKDEPPWWTQTVPVPGEPKPKRPPAEPEKVPELPRVEPKPPVATMYDGLRARSDALRAELKFTGTETKWIAERLRTLGQAVAAAQEIAEQRKVARRLEAFGERLAALQNEVIRREQAERDHIAAIRQDDEQFLNMLFEMVVSSRV